MTTACVTKLRWLLAGLLLMVSATAAVYGYRQVVDGVAVYFGGAGGAGARPSARNSEARCTAVCLPARIILSSRCSRRPGRDAGRVTATITGPTANRKKLEPMIIAGAATFGNYFYMPGPGPYRIALRIRTPGIGHDIEATFTWARS